MAPPFVHLHVHTDYSMLDGLGKPKAYVERAAELKMPALALTDHGNMSGAYEFYTACKAAGIRPIIGCEFYFVPDASVIKDEKIGERFHIVILANNLEGYKTLCELQGIAHANFYYKPVLDRACIEALAYEESENLTVLSGCAASVLSRKVMKEIPGSATEELLWWREAFPNFFIELQHHGTDFDRTLNRRLLKMADKYELPFVITNDPHFVVQEEDSCHDALLAVQTASNVDDPDRFAFSGEGYWLKSRAEMVKSFKRYGEEVWKPGIAETARIAKSIDLKIPEWDKKSWHIPKYRRTPKGKTAFQYLRHLVIKGLQDMGLDDDERYVERAKYELSQIKTIEGFADFLLITREIIQWAVNNKNADHPHGIPVGPGRGSTAGCLVAYLIGVHKCDSIRYKLLFERFLNPARPKMPDIDTDFSQMFRDEVIDHIKEEYGEDFVLAVAAFQTMKVRGAFRKFATALGMPFGDLKKFTDIMAAAWGQEDDEDDEEEDHIRVEHLPAEIHEEYPEVVGYVETALGTKSAVSRHPAGIIIFDPEDSIVPLVPKMWVVSSKRFAAQFDLKSAESMGLMKQDILGLRTLDTIYECVQLVEQQLGIKLDPDSWIPDEEDGDLSIYRMLGQGDVLGVFQLEGGTMATGITKIKPRRFEDIVTCTSLYRKGPMMAGAHVRYIENKKAGKVRVLHPSLKPILEDTWGEMAYQEQLMQIASECAGFDQGGVADLLAAVRFKDEKMMRPLKDAFVSGMRKITGADRGTATEVWKMLEVQASYLFNRSHAAAYSLLTYQTAKLKHDYPLQYFTALMRTVPSKDDKNKAKRQGYLAAAMDHGIKILPPHINHSDQRFSCGVRNGKQWMRFGFEDIKGIGTPTAKKIIAGRIENEVLFRKKSQVAAALTPALVETLNTAGCLDGIRGGKQRDLAALEELVYWQFDDVMSPLRTKYAKKVKLPGQKDGRVQFAGEIISITDKKTKKNDPYKVWKVRWSPSEIFTVNVWDSANPLFSIPKGAIVWVEGKYNAEFRNVSVGDVDQVRLLRQSKREEAA